MMKPIDPLFDFTGMRALVTGGSRGLGKAMAMALAERGAYVVIASRKQDACEEVVSEIKSSGGAAIAISAHVGRWDECDALVQRIYDELGPLDLLINNAGMSPACPSHEVSEKLFDSVINLNFKGAFRLSANIAKRMYDAGGGAIINISSTGALMPLPGVIAYGGAKAALNQMTVSMAKEYAPYVRVNTLSAGPFVTSAHENWTAEELAKFTNFAKRPGNVEEIIAPMLMLASKGSSYVTGAILKVDGGQF